MNDLNRTQHYTTNASYITNGLLDFIPPNATLVEPFCGAGDLVVLFPSFQTCKANYLTFHTIYSILQLQRKER